MSGARWDPAEEQLLQQIIDDNPWLTQREQAKIASGYLTERSSESIFIRIRGIRNKVARKSPYKCMTTMTSSVKQFAHPRLNRPIWFDEGDIASRMRAGR